LSYIGGWDTRIEIVPDHVNAGKPIFRQYTRRWGLRVAAYAINVTTDAGVGVRRRRTHQKARGDEQDGDGQSDCRSDMAETALTAGASNSPTAAEIGDLHVMFSRNVM
jgi:hypothetical protein